VTILEPAGSELDLLERDTFGFWRGFAERPGAACGVDNGVSWYRTSLPLENYNGFIGPAPDVEAAVAWARSWDVPCRWIINRTTASPDFIGSLERSGCVRSGEYPGLVAPVARIGPSRAAGVTVTTVRDAKTFDVWGDILAEAFGFGGALAEYVKQAHAWHCLADPRRTYFLLHVDGEPVATGLLHDAFGAAGVYGIAVRPEWRGRGLGKAATQVTVQEGVRRGAELAVLQATPLGLPVYEGLGFQTLCSFESWTIRDADPERGVTP